MDEEEEKETGSEGLQLNSKEDLIKLITDLTKRVDALTPQKEEKKEEEPADDEEEASDDELENLIRGL